MEHSAHELGGLVSYPRGSRKNQNAQTHHSCLYNSILINSINLHFKMSGNIIAVKKYCRDSHLYENLQEEHNKAV